MQGKDKMATIDRTYDEFLKIPKVMSSYLVGRSSIGELPRELSELR